MKLKAVMKKETGMTVYEIFYIQMQGKIYKKLGWLTRDQASRGINTGRGAKGSYSREEPIKAWKRMIADEDKQANRRFKLLRG